MLKKIPIGIENFKELIEENYFYIDKTKFIEEIVNDGAKVKLFTRPRRFGKTLNMSMLKYFFDIKECEDNKKLFNNLYIKNSPVITERGKYPVIFISMKEIKGTTWEELQKSARETLSNLYENYSYLRDSLNERNKRKFDKIWFEEIDGGYEDSLNFLSKILEEHYNQKVIVLIDEYDTPIQHSYFSGIYDETIAFMRNFLSNTLKDNIYLEKAVLTGILRVARESIFSGLNNLQVYSILKEGYSDKFGFTEEEIEKMLIDFNATEESEEFKKWYNGYIFGDTVIYNPWSVLSYLKDKNNEFMPYWVNTSENKIIKTIIARGSEGLKQSFEELLRGNTIETTIDENIIMADIEANENNIWSFLLLSGYLKVVGKRRENNRIYYSLSIPNIEVQFMYEKMVEDWQGESYVASEYNEMLKALVNFDYEVFEEIFVEYVEKSLSYFDVSGEEPERVYHAFVLGMLVSLSNTHYVLSNKESGYGRYDVMIIPKDKSKIGIIIEFKKARITNKKSIEQLIEEAKNQIEDKKYETELVSRGITNIKKLVIVFKGKEVSVNDVT